VTQSALRDLRAAMSWRGLPKVAKDSFKRTLRNDPLACALLAAARGWKRKLSRAPAAAGATP
jgi:hypothetical protein